eukprot:TRINITY_DN2530_c0_g1_i1.p1 TRINITY_DN2530_c0_g1~~TRINITY_DN2530_c0_g1_i1.p1  ORF type:complete len:402 (+),score=89.67 TRINITY_DN2530_c0_g1_i1:284-1489(+)
MNQSSLNSTYCGLVPSCGEGVCTNAWGPRCFCPPFQFGVDCSVTFSQWIGRSNFIGYQTFFTLLWIFMSASSTLMVAAIIRNPKSVKVLLHKIGIFLIFTASWCRFIYLIVSSVDESKTTNIVHLQRLVIPVLVSVFLFQVIIWFEATRSVLNDTIVEKKSMRKTKTRMYLLAFAFLIIVFIVQFAQDACVISGRIDYFWFDFYYGNLLGVIVLVIAMCFWICYCVITRSIKKLRMSNGRIKSSSTTTLAIAPFLMTFCACITIFFGCSSYVIDMTKPGNWLTVCFGLRLAEFGYCALFLFFMGLPTYRRMWRVFRSKLTSTHSGSQNLPMAPEEVLMSEKVPMGEKLNVVISTSPDDSFQVENSGTTGQEKEGSRSSEEADDTLFIAKRKDTISIDEPST